MPRQKAKCKKADAWDASQFRDVYIDLNSKLCRTVSNYRARVATRHFHAYVRLFNNTLGKEEDDDDPSLLQEYSYENGLARDVWDTFTRGWTVQYKKVVRVDLSRAMALYAPDLVSAIHPTKHSRGRKQHTLLLRADRSQDKGPFSVHDCLPMSIRRLHPNTCQYAVMSQIGHDYSILGSEHTPSKAYLSRVLALLHRILSPMLANNTQKPAPSVIGQIRELTLHDWLRLYEEQFHTSSILPTVFRRHMHILNVLYSQILNADTRRGEEDKYSLLLRCPRKQDLEVDRRHHHQGSLRHQVLTLQRRICNTTKDNNSEERTWAFTPEEIHQIIRSTTEVLPRLVVMLLLTTGLRIGGLCRLRVSNSTLLERACIDRVEPGRPQGRDVPERLTTTEKNGQTRTVFLTATCRILVARWYRMERPNLQHGNDFLFPSLGRGGGVTDQNHISTNYMWKMVGNVLQRADVTGTHGHPHTFRHTVVHLLYMCGTSFDSIAKWIGHASSSVTSDTYGRLRQIDVQGSIRGVPFVDDLASVRQKWQKAARLVNRPYEFQREEWEGLDDGGGAAKIQTSDHIRPEELRSLLLETQRLQLRLTGVVGHV